MASCASARHSREATTTSDMKRAIQTPPKRLPLRVAREPQSCVAGQVPAAEQAKHSRSEIRHASHDPTGAPNAALHNQDENNVACQEGQPHPPSWIANAWKESKEISAAVLGKHCNKHHPSPAAAAPLPRVTGEQKMHRTSKEIGGVLIGRCPNL
jgi:hypothetical protein